MSEKTPFELHRPRHNSQQEAALHPVEQVGLLANMALKESFRAERELKQNKSYLEAAVERAHSDQLSGLGRYLMNLIEDKDDLSLLDLDEADFTTEAAKDLVILSGEDVQTVIESGRISGTDQFLELLVPNSVPDDQREVHFMRWPRKVMEARNPLPPRSDGSFILYLGTNITPETGIKIRYYYAPGSHMPKREIGRIQAFREDEE